MNTENEKKFKNILSKELNRDKATGSQVELIMRMQDDANVKWYTRTQVKKYSQKEIRDLVQKLRNEVQINNMERQAWEDQVNMWKNFG